MNQLKLVINPWNPPIITISPEISRILTERRYSLSALGKTNFVLDHVQEDLTQLLNILGKY